VPMEQGNTPELRIVFACVLSLASWTHFDVLSKRRERIPVERRSVWAEVASFFHVHNAVDKASCKAELASINESRGSSADDKGVV
jgi:hypothetical protein